MSNDEGRIDETARKTADQFFVMYDTVEYAERERLVGLIETALAEQQAPARDVHAGCRVEFVRWERELEAARADFDRVAKAQQASERCNAEWELIHWLASFGVWRVAFGPVVQCDGSNDPPCESCGEPASSCNANIPKRGRNCCRGCWHIACRPEPAQAEVEAACNALLSWQWGKQMPEGMPDRLQRVIAAARRCAQAESELQTLLGEHMAMVAERDALRERVAELERENGRLTDALLVKHGGEPLTLMDQVDALRERCDEAVREMRARADAFDDAATTEGNSNRRLGWRQAAINIRDLADRLAGEKA
jgi:DNA repair exonuclease SbcCD ATPase subunit